MTVTEFKIEDYDLGKIHKIWLHIVNNGIGEPVRIPIFLARGKTDGPTLGITAALHGNELNGIRVIQKLFKYLNIDNLKGNVVGVLIVNVPGLLMQQRVFNDNNDLNRIAPGKQNGNMGEVYINRFIEIVLSQFNYLIDLHTASFGRINSFYVRADMSDPITARLAKLQDADLILHNPPNDNTLRGAAETMGIKSVAVELKNPFRFQKEVINEEITGIYNILYDLKMLEGTIQVFEKDIIFCNDSYWIYTDEGGILRTFPDLLEEVSTGDKIAVVENIFGEPSKEFYATENGIVIGKSTDPINQTGSRIIHLGLNPVKLSHINQDIEL